MANRIFYFFFFLSKNSEETPKGTECYETFKTMQDCFSKYPAVYNKSGGDDDADLDSVLESSSSSNVDSAEQEETDGTEAAAPKEVTNKV